MEFKTVKTDYDEREVTLSDGRTFIIYMGWSRNGGEGWQHSKSSAAFKTQREAVKSWKFQTDYHGK